MSSRDIGRPARTLGHMQSRALITGITGQDGSYLAELLLSKGYEVHGTVRRSSCINTSRIDHLYRDPHEAQGPPLFLHHCDLLDPGSIDVVVETVDPHEVYHLAAQSHVGVSFKVPEYTMQVSVLGTLRLLEAVRRLCPGARVYNASSSEMFGRSPPRQNEDTPFDPCSPYGIGKLAAHKLCRMYREQHKMWIACGILSNHESPRRGETFVTRKITRAVAMIAAGRQDKLYLGNLEARRDWGYAPEYVDAMWRMLQLDDPVDLVIGTGEMHSVGEAVEHAFVRAGLDWQKHVVVDTRYLRPVEVDQLCADYGRAHRAIGWDPKMRFQELIRLMVDADLAACK